MQKAQVSLHLPTELDHLLRVVLGGADRLIPSELYHLLRVVLGSADSLSLHLPAELDHLLRVVFGRADWNVLRDVVDILRVVNLKNGNKLLFGNVTKLGFVLSELGNRQYVES